MPNPLGLVIAVGLALVVGSGCGTSDGPAAAVEGISVERTTTSETPTTTVPVELLPASQMTREDLEAITLDWEGQKYDFGIVHRVEQDGGNWTLTFDRAQIHDEHGVRDGPTLETEPVYIGDPAGVTLTNTNPRLRRFAVRSDAEVLLLSPAWNCTNDLPSWVPVGLEAVAAAPSTLGGQDALTFDNDGLVIRIRLARGCG